MSNAFRGYDAWKTHDPSLDEDVACGSKSPDGQFECNLLEDHQDNDGTNHSHRVERVAYFYVMDCAHCDNGKKEPPMIDGYRACEHIDETPGTWGNTRQNGGSGDWVEVAS